MSNLNFIHAQNLLQNAKNHNLTIYLLILMLFANLHFLRCLKGVLRFVTDVEHVKNKILTKLDANGLKAKNALDSKTHSKLFFQPILISNPIHLSHP